MPTNKNATIRYLALDKCFRNPGKKYYIEDLILACKEALQDIDSASTGVKRRQVYDDIKFMRDSKGFEAPIESYRDGKKAYYRYTALNFSINSQALNEQEARQLEESLNTLSRFKGLPQFEWVEEIKLRLEKSFNLKTCENVISFDENPYLKGKEYIGQIFNAIVNKQVLNIAYIPYKNDSEQLFVIHPYHLKQYNNRWFLFGLNAQSAMIINLALDRILEIKESIIEYTPNYKIDFDEYFEDVIGVSVNNEGSSERVVLNIDNSLFPYIESKPLHGSQRIRQKNERFITVELDIQLNYELESLILSHGEKIKVVEPEKLRLLILNRLSEAVQKY